MILCFRRSIETLCFTVRPSVWRRRPNLVSTIITPSGYFFTFPSFFLPAGLPVPLLWPLEAKTIHVLDGRRWGYGRVLHPLTVNVPVPALKPTSSLCLDILTLRSVTVVTKKVVKNTKCSYHSQRNKSNPQKLKWWAYRMVKIALTSTVFDWSTRVTDRRTIAYSALSIMLSRAKNEAFPLVKCIRRYV